MIPRYTLPEMASVWTDENKYRAWLTVELAVCEVQAKHGRVPSEDLATIKEKAGFNVERIEEIESEVQHDVIAFLTSVAEYVGPSSRYIHQGMTSNDMLDTAQALQIKQAGMIILSRLETLEKVVAGMADQYRHTVMIGRSHGVHAEPITFGLKCGLWYAELLRNRARLDSALEAMRVGMVSGAVGTCAHIPPDWEEEVCTLLGLKVAEVSNQVIQRDRHAQLLAAMAILAATLEKIAVEIRHLQRTEVLEAEEPFTEKQKGSSAMPHKRNPIRTENITGLARLLRGNSMVALENVALWHERDISHSSAERVILPDSFIVLDFMLYRMTTVLEGLQVYPDRMRANMEITHGLIYSQRVLLALVEAGVTREDAYRIVQRNAMECWQTQQPFIDILQRDSEVTQSLTTSKLEACFDPQVYLEHIDYLLQRAGILTSENKERE